MASAAISRFRATITHGIIGFLIEINFRISFKGYDFPKLRFPQAGAN